MLRSWYVVFFQLPWLPEMATRAANARAVERAFVGPSGKSDAFSEADLTVYRANALRPGAMTAMINYYRANVAALGAADRTLSRQIEAPTLLIWGEADPYLGADLTELNGPYVSDLSVQRLPGVSHWVQQEAAGEVNRRLGEWMALKHLTA